jgi:hypothetical protein
MKAYVLTSGAIFALIVVAHGLRVVAEGAHVAADPFFLLMTAAAAGLSVWAFSVARIGPRSRE